MRQRIKMKQVSLDKEQIPLYLFEQNKVNCKNCCFNVNYTLCQLYNEVKSGANKFTVKNIFSVKKRYGKCKAIDYALSRLKNN